MAFTKFAAFSTPHGGRTASLAARTVRSLDALEEAKQLDRVIAPLQRAVRALPLARYRDVLYGLPIGHPLHPALVHLPLGAWVSASLLDVVPGTRRAGRFLVGVGVLAAVPTALSGWVDWAQRSPRQLRTGLVHAAANGTAIGLYAASWAARRDRIVLGRALGFAGLCAAGAGGMVGGHLAYRQAAGANKTEPVPTLVDAGWHLLGRVEDFPVGEAVPRSLGEVPLLVVREAGGEIQVLADRCSHQSGRLSDGEVADGCVTCPLHGSVFRLADGGTVRGPATAPQPAFETTVAVDGTVRTRLPAAS